MREKVEVPVFPAELEATIQKIVRHTGYTRDEVVEGLVTSFFEMVDQADDKFEPTGFALLVMRALKDGRLES